LNGSIEGKEEVETEGEEANEEENDGNGEEKDEDDGDDYEAADDDCADLGREDIEKHMPNINECFSFKKYSQYKTLS